MHFLHGLNTKVPDGRVILGETEAMHSERPVDWQSDEFLTREKAADPPEKLTLSVAACAPASTVFAGGVLHIVHRHADKQDLDVHVSPHTFRRSRTTELIRGGANLYHVMELLGHERLETLKHYTRLTIEDLRKSHGKCHPRERGED